VSIRGGVMRSRLLLIVTGRVPLCLINLIILLSGINSIMDMVPLISNLNNDVSQLENIAEGYATILIAYGVAAEERASIMHFFGLYPDNFTVVQDAVDKICHNYGLALLLLGLFVELCEELVKLPDSIINTSDIESLMFYLAVVLMAITTVTVLRFSWLLAFPQRYMARPGDPVS